MTSRKHKRKQIFYRLLLAVIATVVSLGALELAARIVYGRSDRIEEARLSTEDVLFITDEDVIYKMQPNYEGNFARAEYDTEITINSHGLRDTEHDYQKPEGVYRILILGDSFMAALQVDFEDILPTRLEEMLNSDPRTADSGYRFEVINTGVSGYSALNEYLYLREEGFKYQPDLVLYAFIANDLEDLTVPITDIDGYHYYVDSEADGSIRLDSEGEPVIIKTPVDEFPTSQTMAQQFDEWWVQHSKIYSVLRPGFQRAGPLWRYLRNQFCEPDGEVFYDEPYAINPWPREQEKRAVAFQQIVSLMQQRTQENGAWFASFVIPGIEHIYPENAQKYYLGFNLLQDYWQFDKFDQFLAEFYEEEQIPYLILSEALIAAAAESDQPLYYPLDKHWTAEGHRVGSEAVYEWLVEENLVPTSQ